MAALEGRDELAGALDAILRQHRQVIEQALEPLEEETEVRGHCGLHVRTGLAGS